MMIFFIRVPIPSSVLDTYVFSSGLYLPYVNQWSLLCIL